MAEIRDLEGYMAELEENEAAFVLTEHNCPIHSIAKEYNELCQHELQIFKDVLNVPVERIQHMVKGENACVYKITPDTQDNGNGKNKSDSRE